MIGENKSSENFIKDNTSSIAPYENDGILLGFHIKANKLITALYMVTDIMDKDEPMRNKLRTLGVEILSDTYSVPPLPDKERAGVRFLDEILSFLEIASTVGMISQMNHNILKKEFTDFKDSFVKHNNPILLEEFFGREDTIGHEKQTSTRIGVQRGSTLLKALKNIKQPKISETAAVSNRNNLAPYEAKGFRLDFDNLKKERREAIVRIIKEKKEVYPDSGGATITDIKTSAVGFLASCGEKTLQRELISMVNDGVLNKTGEKRWSRYFLPA